MVKTWTSGDGDDETCEKCGSIYSVIIHRLPARDSDSFTCEICGEILRKWNDTRVPSFTLKMAGEKLP
ncbi:hypothetical protein ABXR19_09695 [Uliginosibacterium flavum]|uniref:ClpX-type ZB domain-containing protein n=1 Tax=Uliginosibacterium flavum TaxID=1396831 RepID=A0ABV2TKK4_9RHOO